MDRKKIERHPIERNDQFCSADNCARSHTTKHFFKDFMMNMRESSQSLQKLPIILSKYETVINVVLKEVTALYFSF